MEWFWVAVLLGIVEGLTEFLPVSSTGHLIVAGHLLGFTGPRADTFEIFIQLGAILAVVALDPRRFAALARPSPGGGLAGPRGCLLLGLTSLPALVLGFLLHGVIKDHLFSPSTVVWALGAGGVAILLAERYRPGPRIATVDGIGPWEALQIGLFQCLSLIPGVSRAGATIVGGLLGGLDRRAAASYSFLAAVPIMAAATLYDLYRSLPHLDRTDAAPFAVGFLVSFVTAWAAMRGFIALLGRFTLRPFAWYRIAVAPLVALLVG
jgi:undecaprenyl-diphosphatase